MDKIYTYDKNLTGFNLFQQADKCEQDKIPFIQINPVITRLGYYNDTLEYIQERHLHEDETFQIESINIDQWLQDQHLLHQMSTLL